MKKVTFSFNPKMGPKLLFYIVSIVFPLTQSYIFEFTDQSNSKFSEINRVYSPYQNQKYKETRTINKLTQNLNQKLELFGNCLIHIINYNGLDFIPFTKPVILSRYDVVWSVYKVSSDIFRKTNKPMYSVRRRFFPIERVPKNDSKIEWCLRHHIERECTDIPSIDISTSIKQWTCEVHFYLMPPVFPQFHEMDDFYNKKFLLIPESFKHSFWNLKMKVNVSENGSGVYYPDVFGKAYSLIDTKERFDVLVTQEKNVNLIMHWRNSIAEKFVGISTKTKREMIVILLQLNKYIPIIKTFILYLTEMILICKFCRVKSLSPVNIGQPHSKNELIDHIIHHNALLDKVNYKIWPLMGSAIDEFMINGNPSPNTRNRLVLIQILLDKTRSLEEIRFRIDARLIGDALRNATILSFPAFGCKSAQLLCEDIFEPFIFFRPTGKSDFSHFHLHTRELMFVSCGTTEMKRLGFYNLVSIFDLRTWICVGVTLLILAFLSSYVFADSKTVRQNKQISKADFERLTLQDIGFISYINLYFIPSLLSYIKAILEQGDPIVVPLYNSNTKLRWIFGCYLLVVIVLSSAYKNENITALTLPRGVIPPDTFDKLVKFNFSIFTRNSHVGGVNNVMIRDTPFLPTIMENILSNLKLNSDEEHRIATFRSELFMYDKMESAFSDLFARLESASSKTKYYMKYTKLIPHWQALFFDSDGSCSIHNSTSYCDVLRFCNKTALLLPKTDARIKYYKMRNEGKDSAYLSKDTLLETNFGISIYRWIDPRILQRLNSLYISGLIDWWTKHVTEFIPKIRSKIKEDNRPRASSMDGNISVIFYVLGVGIGASVLSFFTEMMPKCCKILKIVSSKFTKLVC